MMTYRAMFLCNDDRGSFAGRVEQIEIGATEIRIVCQKFRPPTMRQLPGKIRISRHVYAACGQWASWVGNIYWDAVSVRADEARRLVSNLLANGWTVEEHAEDGPFADLVSQTMTPSQILGVGE